ncbi:MAG: ABC transporter permease [Clostridia bacterium]|nr:ABC transporter permease [Clostridia bacterium]MBQ6614610.1 ABC transporter permease [Clostridia bacterium]
MFFINALPGAVAQGLIWGLMAIGVYISYKILDIADLTVDGSICTGGCVCAVLITAGVPAWISIIVAFLAGALTGVLTGVFHTALGIPSILAGILSQLILYSVNLAILSGRSLVSFAGGQYDLMLGMSDNISSIIVLVGIITVTIVVLWLFFYTEVGLTLKSTGDNPDMSRAQGINVDFNKVLGLAISNGIVALSGALLAQYKGSANINDGRGAIVIGLAAIFIGLSVSLKIKPNFVVSLIGVVCGGIVYYIIYNFVILLGLKTDYLKMLSAIIVAIFLAVPYLKGKYFTKQKLIDAEVEEDA